MKTVYFVRHGQSNANANLFIQQTSETLLTERGISQAKLMAEHIQKLPLEAIIASPFARTKATAQEVGRETGLPIEYSELFIERRRPSVQLVYPTYHPYWLWAQLKLSLFSRFKSYRHSDEETPEDLLDRANRALGFLVERKESTIVVVTHGRFMRALYASMKFGDGITGRMYLHATRTMQMRNTALMVATYNEGAWIVTHWNEDARLL